MVLEYLKLFVTFAKIGMFTIGGGYAMIPLIEREIVNKQWMNKEEFMEMFALTQSLPGVFAVNISIYAGQVVGEHSHDNDLVINVTKSKKLTNMRASGSDDKVRLIPPIQFSLEEALEYIKEDEYVEVTPKAMRMRKVILDEIERKRANKN
jgi:predicted membrane GTPase involved in stress response